MESFISIYKKVFDVVRHYLNMIAGIESIKPIYSDEDGCINLSEGVLAYLARSAAESGNALEAVKRVIEIMQPSDNPTQIAWARLNFDIHGADEEISDF